MSGPWGFTPALVFAWLLLGGFACVGQSQFKVGLQNGAPFSGFECRNTEVSPATSTLRRLSKTELRNTLVDLIEILLGPGTRSDFINSGTLDNAVYYIPDDRDEDQPSLDRSVSGQHVMGYFRMASEMASYMMNSTANYARLRAIGGNSCVTNQGVIDEQSVSCRDQVISRIGLYSQKKPLAAGETSLLLSSFANGPSGQKYGTLIATALMMPGFQYHLRITHPALPSNSNIFPLSSYELASKLAYTLWKSMPDQELFDAAAGINGKTLDTQAGFNTQVQRLMTSPKVRAAMRRFYDEWLQVNVRQRKQSWVVPENGALATMVAELGPPNFWDFLSRYPNQASKEVLDFSEYVTFVKSRGTFEDLLLESKVFPGSEVARVYGTSTWNGDLSSGIPVDPSKRSGLFSLAHFHLTGTRSTRPILQGVFLRKHLLCDSMPLPVDNSTPQGVVIEDHYTERERVAATTEISGTACASCHTQHINPLGFILGSEFNSLGRHRNSIENIYYPDTSSNRGQILLTRPVDASGIPLVWPRDQTQATGHRDLMNRILASRKGHACLVRSYFRFAEARAENLTGDGCSLKAMYTGLTTGAILDMVQQHVRSPEFKLRKKGP